MAEINTQVRFMDNKRLTDWLHDIPVSDISSIVESVTYNFNSRTVFINMRNMLEDESVTLGKQHSGRENAMAELIRLSNTYRNKYPMLLKSYKDWKPYRENLIQTSRTCVDRIGWYSALLSAFRIVTSTADIVGTIMRSQQSKSYWAHFAAENASYFGLFSVFIEMTLSKQLFNKVRESTRKDQEMFQPMKEWFQQTEELDEAVKNLFPYGIDEDLVRRIDKSCSDSDNSVKIFMSIVASSAKVNLNLFKDISFLELAQVFSPSEFGDKWYQKVIYENDPVWIECMKCNLEEEIRKITPFSKEEKYNHLVIGSTAFTTGIGFKPFLDVLTIYSAVNRLWKGDMCEDSNMLKELSRKTDRELDGMRRVVKFLKPSGIEIDEDLK